MQGNISTSINKTVFDSFKTLTSGNDGDRITGSLLLLAHITQKQDPEKFITERNYVLNRLIRGLGAATYSSRAGFFSTLVGFFSIPENADILHSQIMAVLNKQLSVGKSMGDKEDSDAFIGHILLCGALLRSNRLANESNINITECVDILITASKQKAFHASLANSFLVELFEKLDNEQFRSSMWPSIEKELKRPWEKQTINTLHCLLLVQQKYPELINAAFLQRAFKADAILTKQSYKHLCRIYWGTTSMTAITHPSYDILSKFLLSQKRSELQAFWIAEVNETLAAPNKIKEVVTLKMLTSFLKEDQSPLDAKLVNAMLTPQILNVFITSLKTLNKQKHDVLVTFYNEFFNALVLFFTSTTEDTYKIEIIKKIILQPGQLMVEKYMPQKSIQQLLKTLTNVGAHTLFEMYKTIVQNRIEKKSKEIPAIWSNVERHHALQMMQYILGLKCVQADVEWRTSQLKFLMTIGLFYVNDKYIAEQKDRASELFTKDLAATAKTVFYTSLQTKLANLNDEKAMLLGLINHVDSILQSKQCIKYIRNEWTTESQSAWKSMRDLVQHPKKHTKHTLVFQILFLHMGMQLFREAETAQIAIADLVNCMEKTLRKNGKKPSKLLEGQFEDEPEWIEVVVDLLLHLLSQNTTYMRTVVNNVFPQLCAELTLTAVHQILATLDMKKGKNPLSNAAQQDEAEEEDNDEEDNSESDDSDSEMQSAEEEDDEDGDEEGDETVTVSDQLRSAVSEALGGSVSRVDDDNESIDLNDLSDAEAERLDRDLSLAFQALKQNDANGGKVLKKKSKIERYTNTTLMHFRIRVLDLLDIYIRTNPIFSVTIEIMLALFDMINHCASEEMHPLADKIDKVLKRLLALRQFGNTEDVSVEHIRDLLKSLTETKVNTLKLGYTSKCYSFLISNAYLLPEANADQSIVEFIKECCIEFVRARNPRLPVYLLKDIFKMRWIGVWSVAETIAVHGLDNSVGTRALRRAQVLELLAIVYLNHGFVLSDLDHFKRFNKTMEGHISKFVQLLSSAATAITSNEFTALSLLLAAIHKCQAMPLVQKWKQWDAIATDFQTIRQHVVAVALPPYAKCCQALGLPVIKQTDQGSQKHEVDDGAQINTKKRKSIKSNENGKKIRTK